MLSNWFHAENGESHTKSLKRSTHWHTEYGCFRLKIWAQFSFRSTRIDAKRCDTWRNFVQILVAVQTHFARISTVRLTQHTWARNDEAACISTTLISTIEKCMRDWERPISNLYQIVAARLVSYSVASRKAAKENETGKKTSWNKNTRGKIKRASTHGSWESQLIAANKCASEVGLCVYTIACMPMHCCLVSECADSMSLSKIVNRLPEKRLEYEHVCRMQCVRAAIEGESEFAGALVSLSAETTWN